MGGVHDDETGEYQTPFLANVLHSLPHWNVSLHIVNSTFAPQSEVYLESLGILASVPAAWLIITLGILLAYLATRCCDNSGRRKPRALTAPRLLLAATALLCAAATGLGLYANDDLHNGLVQTFMAARMLDDIIANIRNQTKTISYSLTEAVSHQLTELSDIFDGPVTNTTAQMILFDQLQTVRQNHSLAVRATADIQRPLASLDARPVIELSERWELYRWAAAMGVLSGLLALCAVVVVGAARRSRRCLVAASVLALVSAAAAWLLASIGLAAAVALADLCVAPEQYASSVVAQRGLQPELLRYYTHCETARVNPFTQRLREAQGAVGRMRIGINGMTKVAIPLFQPQDLRPKLSALTNEVNAIDRSLSSLTALLDCRGAHAHWVNGTKGLCTSALPGLALLLLATATAGLLLSVLVCLASHVWIYVRKRHDYSQVDEADPFIPATAASQAIAARTLQSGTLSRGIPASAPPHHHRSQGSYKTTNYDPPPSYAQAAQMHEKANEDVHNQSYTIPNPQMIFDNDNLDGCDGASSRHTLGRDGLTGGGHLAHLGRSGHATLGRLPSHSAHHDHINLTGPNNDGFKSYGHRTEINGFDREFNAITGLNGSGKSNILDAICFVLGISNLSQVRAGQLQDLVYKNGQAGITKASVTITFDNRDKEHKPPGYDDYEEITVARQVVVGGKNKYMINGTNVQNKRVQDLFCSVQLNVNNPHFLIMQGRITKVLNMKPPEILSMIEEAAGTRMYETKKQGAEKLIERKDIKLKELQSIINDEITPKIQKLEKERDQYLQYQRIERELEHLNKLWIAWQRIILGQSVTKSQNNLSALENEIQENHLRIKNLENESKNIDMKVTEMKKKKDAETGGRLGECTDILKQKDKIEAKAAASLKAGKENINSEQRKLKQLEKSLEDDKSALSSKKKEFGKFEEKFTKLRDADVSDAEALNIAQKRFNALSAGMVVGEDGEAATLQEQLMNVKQKEKDAFTKIRQSQMQLERYNEQLTRKTDELKESSGEYNENKNILSKNEKEALVLEKQLASLGYDETHAQTINDRRQELREREKMLRVHFERFDSQYPQLSFNYRDPEPNFDRQRVHGPICKLITLKDRSTAAALEIAAGGRLYNVVVDTDITSKLLLQKGNLQQRTTIIPLNKIQSSEIDNRTLQIAQKLVGSDNVKTALSLIEYSPKVHSAMCYVFGNVFVCRDLKIASKVAFDKQILRRCVTLDGDIVDPAGTLSGGAPGQAGRILTALDDMRECINEKKECEQELIRLDNEAKSMASVVSQYESLRHELDLKSHKIKMAQQLLQQTVHYQKQAEVEELKLKIGELKEEIKKYQQIENESKKLANKIECEVNSAKGGREKQLKDAQAELDKLQKQAEKSRQCWIQHEQEFETLKMEISELEKAVKTGENQITSLIDTVNELKENIKTLEQELKDAQDEVQLATASVNEAKKEITLYTNEIKQSLEQKNKFEEESAELALNIQKLEHQRSVLKTEVEDFFQKEQDLIKQNEWILNDSEHNLKASKLTEQEGENLGKQTAQLQEAKKKLGRHVNMRAMSLLGDEEKQYKEMIKRKNMVENDKKSIFEIIAKLDKKKEKALMVAWTQVNKDFGSIFGTLLSGANAKLQPPPGKRVLDGLEVKVSFGGIWKDNLSELSGGQRSLVALSLILSMLLFKPAPLYILDEVDAALDLSHTQNIGNMLKSHFSHSQFIVVSLKDGMFNNANVLFRTKFIEGASTIERTVCKK